MFSTWISITAISICALWAIVLIYMYVSTRTMPLLREVGVCLPTEQTEWPLLSVIICARNEADHLEAALDSVLQQDYPSLEIVLVNDRSTDATGEIIDRLAASNARVKAVNVTHLPAGWLGKVHALHQGVRHARGEWYLFSDADVYCQAGTLRRAVGYAIHHKVNHVTCLPELIISSAFWLDVTIRSFYLLLCIAARLAEVNRNKSKWPIGVGAFNLVEAAAFKRTPGFEWLRMEPGDDIGLGLMLKKVGARTRLLNADGAIRVPWYESLRAMIRGLEKNSFGPGANYSYLRQVLMVLSLWCLILAPPISMLVGFHAKDAALLGAGAAAFMTTFVTALAMPRRALRDILAYLFLPIGTIVVSLIMLRSAWKCLRNGGIDWRGTHYPVEQLRRGQRVKFSPLGQDIHSS
jgi:glycosyltransferase involved in cell wall biosynthesis